MTSEHLQDIKGFQVQHIAKSSGGTDVKWMCSVHFQTNTSAPQLLSIRCSSKNAMSCTPNHLPSPALYNHTMPPSTSLAHVNFHAAPLQHLLCGVCRVGGWSYLWRSYVTTGTTQNPAQSAQRCCEGGPPASPCGSPAQNTAHHAPLTCVAPTPCQTRTPQQQHTQSPSSFSDAPGLHHNCLYLCYNQHHRQTMQSVTYYSKPQDHSPHLLHALHLLEHEELTTRHQLLGRLSLPDDAPDDERVVLRVCHTDDALVQQRRHLDGVVLSAKARLVRPALMKSSKRNRQQQAVQFRRLDGVCPPISMPGSYARYSNLRLLGGLQQAEASSAGCASCVCCMDTQVLARSLIHKQRHCIAQLRHVRCCWCWSQSFCSAAFMLLLLPAAVLRMLPARCHTAAGVLLRRCCLHGLPLVKLQLRLLLCCGCFSCCCRLYGAASQIPPAADVPRCG
jgi:hypothetical protein